MLEKMPFCDIMGVIWGKRYMDLKEYKKKIANLSVNDPRTFCEGVLTLFSC